MSPIRLLFASLFAVTVHAAAQSPTTPTIITMAPSISAQTNPLIAKSKVLALVQNAQIAPPCFTLRSYGFTRRDLQSDNPRPSTYSTCTPAKPNITMQVNGPAKFIPVK